MQQQPSGSCSSVRRDASAPPRGWTMRSGLVSPSATAASGPGAYVSLPHFGHSLLDQHLAGQFGRTSPLRKSSQAAAATAAAYYVPPPPSLGPIASLSVAMPTASTSTPEFLPPLSPVMVYTTANSAWTAEELEQLQQSLAANPPDKGDNVTRYIRIAAAIPTKCVRDVVFKLKSLGPRAKPEQQAALSDTPSSTRSSSTAMAASTPSSASSSVSAAATAAANSKRIKMEATTTDIPSLVTTATAFRNEPSNQLSNQHEASDPARVLHMSNQDEAMRDAHLSALLQDNVLQMTTMRTNLLQGKLDENKEPMIKFRDNCQTVLQAIGSICNSIPPMPIKMDTSLIGSPTSRSSNQSSNHHAA